jgi:predicted nucleotidyltransferase
VQSSPAHEELCTLARATISRRHARHYFGFARSQWKLFQAEQPPRVKPLLYTFRVLLTGIHLMRSGQLNANLEELNAEFKLPHVDELIALKRQTKEKITLSSNDSDYFIGEYERLLGELGHAERDSKLQGIPDNRADFDALLRRLRSAS